MSSEIQVFTETFFISNESCVFAFDGYELHWRGNSVQVEKFLTVDFVHTGNCCFGKRSKKFPFRKIAHTCKGHDTIVIYYAQCQKKNKLRLNNVKFQGESHLLSRWLGMLRAAMEKSFRPKQYLALVNPFAGRQNAVDIYTKKVKPIFDIAQVEATVVVTQNRSDFERVIYTGVDGYDAILAVGGDGTISEIVNCLVTAHMYSSDCPEGETVPKIDIPIAVIPCGSTDCVAYTLNGTRDVETNAIYSVIGSCSSLDVCRAVSPNGLNRFFVSVFTYGYLSDLILESEKFRWMGPIRYNYAGLLTLLRSKEYYGQLDLVGEQCIVKPSVGITRKKLIKKKSKTLSLYMIPIVPTVEPGPECLEPRVVCRPCPKKLMIELPEHENRTMSGNHESDTSKDEEMKSSQECRSCDDLYEWPKHLNDTPETVAWVTQTFEGYSSKNEDEPPEGGDEGIKPEPMEEDSCQELVPAEVVTPNVVGDQKPSQELVLAEKFTIKGRYFLIACANISCASELTPNGIAPHCVPGDGHMNVVLFQPNSIRDLYKIYTRLTSRDQNFLLSDLSFVTTYRTKHVKISITQKDVDKVSSANCDGELFHDSTVDITLHEGIVQFFSRRSCAN